MIRVLLVDDQAMIRTGFAAILSTADLDGEAIEVVGEAADGAQAVTMVQELLPDVVLMDVQMPVMDGIEATRRITAEDGAPAVLVLTTFDRDDYLFSTLDAGASGFLLKTAEAETLINAVRVLARGDALLAPEVTRRVIARNAGAGSADGSGAESPSAPTRSADAAEPAQAQHPSAASPDAAAALDRTPTPEAQRALNLLTARERDVFDLVVQGLSNRQIAERLFLGDATVKTHLSNALMKLQIRDRIRAVIWAYENHVVG